MTKTRQPKGSALKSRNPENVYRDLLMQGIPGAAKEVVCKAGRIDIVTPTEIIEVKHYHAIFFCRNVGVESRDYCPECAKYKYQRRQHTPWVNKPIK